MRLVSSTNPAATPGTPFKSFSDSEPRLPSFYHAKIARVQGENTLQPIEARRRIRSSRERPVYSEMQRRAARLRPPVAGLPVGVVVVLPIQREQHYEAL